MNQSVLKAYAPKARKDFIEAIGSRASFYGITKNKIETGKIEGNVVIVGGKAFHSSIESKRQKLISRITNEGFDHVIDNIAYTWFNRFIAIRYMELHDYLDHGIRVLSNPESNDNSPEILEKVDRVSFKNFNKQKALELKLDGTKDSEIYQMLIVAQCNELSYAMPFLFENVDDESELLLPENLLHSDSIIRELVRTVPDEDWKEVEIIGWLYQYYISEKKDQVIGSVVKSEDIPAATQLFTPNWIVQYMVQNSLGAKWMATYPDSALKEKMPYYIESAKQSAEVAAELKEITPASLNPEELTLIDPASGSGHILVEAYNLLKEIYLERSYRLRDIPRLILEKNLFGLDIDDRAAQLTALSILMKARGDDRSILTSPPKLNVTSIQETNSWDADEIAENLFYSKADFTKNDIKNLIVLFENAKTFGSLIFIPEEVRRKLPVFEKLVSEDPKDMMASGSLNLIKSIVKQATLLARQYDAVVANPPYMGSKYMAVELKKYVSTQFPDVKSDLFSAFIVRNIDLTKKNGNLSFMTPFVWMFISSYEDLRLKLINNCNFTSLIQLEYSGFDGATVPICTFALSKELINDFKGGYIKLSNFKGSANQSPKVLEAIRNRNCGWFFEAVSLNFKKIPGSPIAFWVNDKIRDIFANATPLDKIAETKQGLATCNNNLFLRMWYEVDQKKISYHSISQEAARSSTCKWFPYNKGGGFRQWYGNNEFLVNWENSGEAIHKYSELPMNYSGAPVRAKSFYFREGITYGLISSFGFSARRVDVGFVFDVGGSMVFPTIDIEMLLGFLCSKLTKYFINILNPTLNYQVGDIQKLPILFDKIKKGDFDWKRLVEISKYDWDSYEISWDFKKPRIFNHKSESIKDCYTKLREFNSTLIAEARMLEHENNRLFINAYNLENEISADVLEAEITLKCNPFYRYSIDKLEHERVLISDTMKELISYITGCMLGRYAMDRDGIAYAQSLNDDFDKKLYTSFPADADGIIPVLDQSWFKDDIVNLFIEFVETAWPKHLLKENLQFIADAISERNDEQPEIVIRKYFTNSFFKDHVQLYKKRPIYWMFSSGKYKAFQCLVYLHRYNDGTLSKMRTEYVIPLQARINSRISQLESDIASEKSGALQKKLEKEKEYLLKQKIELQEFDEKLRHYADQRIKLDLDDGVKANYVKFGDLLAEVKLITGGSED